MGQIKVKKNVGGIEGLCIIEPTLHGDSRGYFMETYNKNDMAEAGLTMEFVQDNQSASTKGVLRGLHFQKQHPQGKLVRVINGTVFDVVVDLRSHSGTYGKWFGEILSAENNKQFYIPEDLPTDFLFCLIQQNSVINVQTSIIRETKADLPGTTQKSVLNGQNSSENILAALLQKDII